MPPRKHPGQLPKSVPAELPPGFVEASHENGINPTLAEKSLQEFARIHERANVLVNLQRSIAIAEAEGLTTTDQDKKLVESFRQHSKVTETEIEKTLPAKAKMLFAQALGIDVWQDDHDTSQKGPVIKTIDDDRQEELDYRFNLFSEYYSGPDNKDRLNETLSAKRKIFIPNTPDQASLLGFDERPKINAKRSGKKVASSIIKVVYSPDYTVYEGEPGEPNHAISIAKRKELQAEATWALNRRASRLSSFTRRHPNAKDQLHPTEENAPLPKKRANESDDHYKDRLTAPQLETYAKVAIAHSIGFISLKNSGLISRDQLDDFAKGQWYEFKQKYDEAKLEKKNTKKKLPAQLRFGDVA